MLVVVGLGNVLAEDLGLQADQLQAALFKAADALTHKSTSNAVGLHHYKGTFAHEFNTFLHKVTTGTRPKSGMLTEFLGEREHGRLSPIARGQAYFGVW